MRTVFFWVIKQRVVVISYRSSEQSIGPIFKGQESNCPETSIKNYHHSLRNNPEQRSAQIMKTAKWGAAPARPVTVMTHQQAVRPCSFRFQTKPANENVSYSSLFPKMSAV
jgi:hypothetical protein